MRKLILFLTILGILQIMTFCKKDDPEVLLTFGTVTDIEGNAYRTTQIGTQTWMVDNLKTTKYNDGTAIPNATSDIAWSNYTTGAYCWYNNNINNKPTYGALYNWFAVTDNHKLCPTGWHIPSDTEWNTLINYLGGESTAGGKMKESGTTHWNTPNAGANNSSGFTGVPGGGRNMGGSFAFLGETGFWWSNTADGSMEAWTHYLNYNYATVSHYADFQSSGFSVRCVKD